MILVILAICIIVTITFALADLEGPAYISFVGSGIALVITILLGTSVSGLRVIDDKIAMYQAENVAIEAQVDALVQNYMEHEASVFDNAKAKSPIVLAQMYPELRSDELVAAQLDIYVANNEKIKELKLAEIEGSIDRWWLYFGR